MELFPPADKRTRMYALAWALATVLVAILINHQDEQALTGAYTPAPPAKATKNKKKIKVPAPGGVTAYPPGTGKDLGIPASDAPGKHVVAAGEIPPTEGGATVAATFDEKTGETTIDYKLKERPFLSFDGRTEAGIRYGIGTHGEAATIYVRRDVVRIGSVHLGGIAEGNFDSRGPEAKIAVDARIEW